ncbi:MAG: tubulin-like doman-containing protein, partial [Solirubrobacterales bacterium]
MTQKVLLIGVGGSGGKLLRYIGRELERRVSAERAATPTDTVRPAGPLLPPDIQFLQIDVREHSDAVADDVPVTVSGEYAELGLAESTHNYPFYDKTVISRPGAVDAIAGWRPDPRGDFPPPYLGAGQYRAIGRVVGLATMEKISMAVDRSIAKISDAGLEANHENNPLVIVASSLAGGSGSGIFLDVVELVKGKATGNRGWLKDNLVTVLFSADMFEALDPSMIEGVYANSLAALSELINGHEHKGSVAESEVSLMESSGFTPPNGQRSAPYNFLIGRTVGGTVIGSPNDVYRSSAKAFAAFLHNEEINADFNSYLGVNGLARPRRAVSSIGYSNVTLGNELFRRYMALSLAKQAIRTLIEGHKKGNEKDPHKTEQEMVDEKVSGERLNFFDRAKLHEKGVDRNDVLDALRGGDAASWRTRLETIRGALAEELSDSRRQSMDKKQWWELFKSEFHALTEPFKVEEKARIAGRARAWVVEAQDNLLNATSHVLATQGFRVAIGLLDALKDQLSEAADELEQEADTERSAQESKWNETMLKFKSIVDTVIGPNHGAITGATEPAIEALNRELEVDLRRHTAELIRELVADVIPELRLTITMTQDELLDEFNGRFRETFDQLPEGEPPSHLLATRNE